jgi:hypothetical protein
MAQALREASEPEDPDLTDEPLNFVIGQDGSGHWILVETHGLYGGIFCSKDAALRFASFETADRKGVLTITSEPLEFPPRRRPARYRVTSSRNSGRL